MKIFITKQTIYGFTATTSMCPYATIERILTYTGRHLEASHNDMKAFSGQHQLAWPINYQRHFNSTHSLCSSVLSRHKQLKGNSLMYNFNYICFAAQILKKFNKIKRKHNFKRISKISSNHFKFGKHVVYCSWSHLDFPLGALWLVRSFPSDLRET